MELTKLESELGVYSDWEKGAVVAQALKDAGHHTLAYVIDGLCAFRENVDSYLDAIDEDGHNINEAVNQFCEEDSVPKVTVLNQLDQLEQQLKTSRASKKTLEQLKKIKDSLK